MHAIAAPLQHTYYAISRDTLLLLLLLQAMKQMMKGMGQPGAPGAR